MSTVPLPETTTSLPTSLIVSTSAALAGPAAPATRPSAITASPIRLVIAHHRSPLA